MVARPQRPASRAATRRLKVAIIPEWYPSVAQPVKGTFVREQARAVAPYADVTVVYLDPDAPAWSRRATLRENDQGFAVRRRRAVRSRIGPLNLVANVVALRTMLRELARQGWSADVLHAHVFPAGAISAAVGGRSTPLVLTEHYTGVTGSTLSRSERAMARYAYGRATTTCPVSSQLGGAIHALAPAARVRVVPNSVDMDVFAPAAKRQRPAGRVRLLTVAMLTAVKAIPELLKAVAALSHRYEELRLDVIGDGPERARLEEQARTLRVAQLVRFHGRQSKAEVAAAMRSADLFVLPSLIENLPCVVIEALASGLPVVATDVGGLPELVPPERGMLVPPGDSAALAKAIEAALARRDDWNPAELSRAARERYGLEATGREWLDVYREAIVRVAARADD